MLAPRKSLCSAKYVLEFSKDYTPLRSNKLEGNFDYSAWYMG